MLPNMSDPENVAEYESWKEWFRNMIHPDDVSRRLVVLASLELEAHFLKRFTSFSIHAGSWRTSDRSTVRKPRAFGRR